MTHFRFIPLAAALATASALIAFREGLNNASQTVHD